MTTKHIDTSGLDMAEKLFKQMAENEKQIKPQWIKPEPVKAEAKATEVKPAAIQKYVKQVQMSDWNGYMQLAESRNMTLPIELARDLGVDTNVRIFYKSQRPIRFHYSNGMVQSCIEYFDVVFRLPDGKNYVLNDIAGREMRLQVDLADQTRFICYHAEEPVEAPYIGNQNIPPIIHQEQTRKNELSAAELLEVYRKRIVEQHKTKSIEETAKQTAQSKESPKHETFEEQIKRFVAESEAKKKETFDAYLKNLTEQKKVGGEGWQSCSTEKIDVPEEVKELLR